MKEFVDLGMQLTNNHKLYKYSLQIVTPSYCTHAFRPKILYRYPWMYYG